MERMRFSSISAPAARVRGPVAMTMFFAATLSPPTSTFPEPRAARALQPVDLVLLEETRALDVGFDHAVTLRNMRADRARPRQA